MLTLMMLGLAGPVAGFSAGSPICEVDSLPLEEMSPTLASPPPTGWTLRVARPIFMPGRALRVEVVHADPERKLRGVLLWAKSGPATGAGAWLPDGVRYAYIPEPGGCGEWAISHTDAEAKGSDLLTFWWLPGEHGAVILRGFLIEDCAAGGGCRDQQALTDLWVLQPRLFFDSFEPD